MGRGERERARERGRERERGSRSNCSCSFGSGDAQDAANCPGSPRWFTAARRRDKPSTAARKSAHRSRRTRSDSSKHLLRFNNFHIKKKERKKKRSTPENSVKTQQSAHTSFAAERCLFSATDSTLHRRFDWT